MTEATRVTVVIPCFNAEVVLERALRAVLAQDVPGIRVIVVDDASTDGSAAVAESWARDHAEIAAVRQPENRGAAAARNRGLGLADGDFVSFLDSDDELLAGFLERTLDVLGHMTHVASVSTGVDIVGASQDLDPIRYAALVNSGPSNVVVRRAVAQLIDGFPESSTFRGQSAGEDVVYRTILGECFSQVHLADKLLRYHVKEGSHLERFIERTVSNDRGLTFEQLTKEEAEQMQMGSLTPARMKPWTPLLPTPTVNDSKNNGRPAQHKRKTKALNVVAGGKLNPTWVEWLMGYPTGWTDLKHSETV